MSKRRFLIQALLATALFCTGWQGLGDESPAGENAGAWSRPVAGGHYVVLVSQSTYAQAPWRDVTTALRRKYDASLIVYPDDQPSAALPALRRLFPHYACFVARPSEAGRDFVVRVHRLTRQLDDDPYTDLQWAILTGYEAADALRIARHAEPLEVKRAASSMGPGVFESLPGGGFASNETNPHDFWIQPPGGPLEKRRVDPDPVRALVEAFNNAPPDLFQTSGHATERDWQIGYNVRAGQFRCEKGQLYGLSTDGSRHNIHSPHPKIYLPLGNCLIGHVPGADCMATAWMHSGGVVQMFGYTAVTFHGFMGWGIGSYFNGPISLSEAFYFNNQALIYELQTEFPEQAAIEFESYDQRQIRRLAAKHKLTSRKLLGHLWDRDTVAFYGDPAWLARKPGSPGWSASVQRRGEQVVVTVKAETEGQWGNRPLMVWLPERMRDIRSVTIEGAPTPVVTDNFVLIPLMTQPRQRGQKIEVRFGARPVRSVATSSAGDPIVVQADNADDTKKTDQSAAAQAVPALRRPGIRLALQHAGDNAPELQRALTAADGARRDDMIFLVENMPRRDLRELSADYLLENVDYARRALDAAPWREKLPKGCYENHVLPYASISERRDRWRRPFYERFAPLVKECATPGEAAVKLNQSIFEILNVSYHATKRPRPDQGPLESIEAGYASCSGLAVLLIDACRAVGVPARFTGVARWTESRGNHSWVEVWHEGQWHCLGASESKALNKVWFAKAAAQADPANPFTRIYAAQFERSTLRFPLAWDPYASYISAVDVTASYKQRFANARRDTPSQ